MNLWRFEKKEPSVTATLQFDWPMMLVVGLLCVFGLLMVVSTSMDMAMEKYNNEWFIASRQFLYMLFGLLIGFLIYHFLPSQLWFDLSRWLMLLVIVLLFLVLFSPLGVFRNGSYRWLDLGFFTLQVSELAKLAVLLYLADYINRHSQGLRKQWKRLPMPSALVGLVALLIFLEPDYGTTAIILCLGLAMFLLAGIGWLRFSAVLAFVSAQMYFLLFLDAYRTERLLAYLDPWRDPYGSGYQLSQSLIAVSRGQWFGEGAGAGIQKLYLPEAHNDFIFSIVIEEFGFLGAVVLMFLFAVLIVRCFVIGRRAEHQAQRAGAFFCYGTGIWLGLQAFGNMSVAVGLLPTKGLTLPLISAGGSSLVVVFIMLAIVQRLYYELCCQDVVFMHHRRMRQAHAR